MSNKTAFWIFLLGTASSAVLFLALTADTHRQVGALTHADRLSDEVVAGKKVWEKYNCNDCHTILGFGGYYAPDMTKAYKRLGPEGIQYRVLKPEEAFAASRRKMPRSGMSPGEAVKLTAFLKWVAEIDNGDWPPQDSARRVQRSAVRLAAGEGLSLGAALVKEKGCLSCHSVNGVGGSAGGPLDRVEGFDKETLERFLQDPKAFDPASKMPPQQLTEAERDAIAAHLLGE